MNSWSHKAIYVVIALFVAAAVVGLYAREPQEAEEADAQEYEEVSHPLIRVTTPGPGDAIQSPLMITGEARGNWYFEATFPVVLVDWDGRIIAEHYAEAESNWMTTDFVPFRAILSFEKPFDESGNVADFMRRGTLVLRNSNPSGLPEYDDAIEIPVRFE